MLVRHFEIKTPEVTPPGGGVGWEQLPLGYYWMTKCRDDKFKKALEETYKRMNDAGHMPGGQFQQDCLLSILADVSRDSVRIVELGAGWGRLCLELAGAVDFQVVPCKPQTYHCLAVEAEPTHFAWLKEHFEAQSIAGTPVFGAISNKNGTTHFDAYSSNPDAEYGQAMLPFWGRLGLPSVGSLRRIFTGKAVKVPMYTLDNLVSLYNLESIDIVQMDVQGAEYDVIRGAVRSIEAGVVDYFLINIHRDEYNGLIANILTRKYDLVVDLKRACLGSVEGFPPIAVHDGIQLYKRRGL